MNPSSRRLIIECLTRAAAQFLTMNHPRLEVELLWDLDYWDGPLTGLVQHEGRLCYFEMSEENDYEGDWHRRYLVRQLSAEEIKEEQRWHEAGTARPKRDYRTNRIFGWFQR